MSVYYEDEKAMVYHGDCIEVMRSMPDRSVDAVVTDPPYGIRFMGQAWDSVDIVAHQERGKRTSPMPAGVGGPNGGTQAIRRHEAAFGKPAPQPTVPGKTGRRLSPMFVEWMMGLPAGHITSPEIGLSRVQQLRALGNGVVPQQAAAAIGLMASQYREIELGVAP